MGIRHASRTVLAAAAATMIAVSGAAQDPSLERLETSPRHHEWVAIPQGDRTIHAFVVFPEVSKKVPAVIVIHENRGLTDWVRSVADQLAEHGYIAIAPDLLSGMGPDGGKTSDFPDSNAARDGIYKLTQEQVSADLEAVANYAKRIPAANGVIVVGGFCWGGHQTFEMATRRADLAAAFVFYGTPPSDDGSISKIAAPVYGFYGGNDERVNATIDATVEKMKAAGKRYDPVIYPGAGHGFMRSGEAPDATDANRDARAKGWDRWLKILGAM